MIPIIVLSSRPGVPSDSYQVPAVPHVGDLIRTPSIPAARVSDVQWSLTDAGETTITVYVR